MELKVDDLTDPRMHALLAEHLREMHAHSPACSVHALDLSGLRQPGITVWSAWEGGELLGCGALRELDPSHGELKSMRIAPAHRGRGLGRRLLDHLVAEACRRGYTRLSLETGASAAFGPAQSMYARAGFQRCGPFGGYADGPHSVFMSRVLPA